MANQLGAETVGEERPVMSASAANALVFLTSFCVLLLEILAGRLLAPLIGVSLETFTGIIGTVLAGIAAGSMVGGRAADRRDPSLLLGPILIVGGVLTWVAPVLVTVLNPLRGADPVTIVVLTALTFFAPATVLSAITPMVAKILIRDLGDTGRIVGNLSAAGTAGALAGTFTTGFVLVRFFPTRPLIVVVGAVLVALGVWMTGLRAVRGNPPAVLGAVFLGGLAVIAPERCDTETAYACVETVADTERATGRAVVLNQAYNSYVDLADPQHLEFRYVRLFASVVEAAKPGPVTGLHLGGAGLTFPRYLQAVEPEGHQTVLEIDGQLAEYVVDLLPDGATDGVEIVVGDARLTTEDLPDNHFDVVVGDAFSGLSVPWHLTTDEYVAELGRVVTDGGLVVMNVIDGGNLSFVRAEMATYGQHFAHVALVAPPDHESGFALGSSAAPSRNYVIVASEQPLGEIAIDPADGVWIGAVDAEEYWRDALVLTDDFAPVDQMRDLG